MTDKLLNKTVQLTVLSPLFIGAGKEAILSPYTDFVQDDRQLVYLDERKFQDALAEKSDLIDELVQEIKNGFDNNRSDFSLSEFISTRLNLLVSDVERCRLPIDGDIGKKPVRSFIATAGRPFIPGSTIKGAMRTAVTVHWLQNRRGGKRQFEKIKNLVAEGDWKTIKKINIEQLCMTALSLDPVVSSDAFRYLRVSDSDAISHSVLHVSEVERVSTVTISDDYPIEQQTSIPQWSETMPPGTNTNFSIALLQSQEITGFKFIETQSVQELFSILNAFSKDACLHELKVFDNCSNNFEGFKDFYANLERQIASLGSTEAIVRIGAGKTWFDNSIGLAIDQDDFGPEFLFGAYLKLLKLGNQPFPSTRSAVMKNGQPALPLGWVKLSVEG
jgi:CRISPR-associated protein Csm5